MGGRLGLSSALTEIFNAHHAFLWGLCYRLTGNAADADDLVQETFVRALSRPPARTEDPWRPWLVRVAVNLGRDLLRKRRRRSYEGQWLPSPIETDEGGEPPSFEPAGDSRNPAARYDQLESVSFAFLLALEALTPSQRAVLLLRDVFDYSVREVAETLGMTEANVKTTHLRARRSMAAYDGDRQLPTRTVQQRTRKTLERFLACLAARDLEGIKAILADDVRVLSDAGGEFYARRVPLVGRGKVARLFLGIQRVVPAVRGEMRMLNGLPSLVVEFTAPRVGWAPRVVIQCRIGHDGRIRELYMILASRKLTGVRRAVVPRGPGR